MDAAAPRKRALSPPASPTAARCGGRSPRARSREQDEVYGRNRLRGGSVNREEEASSEPDADAHGHEGAKARWSPPREVAQRHDDAGEADAYLSESESERNVPRDVPCCSRWAACDMAGACVHGARLVRRIHDEDGAAVDVVYTRQFGAAPGGGPRAVVYKTYDTRDNDCLSYLVATEVRTQRNRRPRAPRHLR